MTAKSIIITHVLLKGIFGFSYLFFSVSPSLLSRIPTVPDYSILSHPFHLLIPATFCHVRGMSSAAISRRVPGFINIKLGSSSSDYMSRSHSDFTCAWKNCRSQCRLRLWDSIDCNRWSSRSRLWPGGAFRPCYVIIFVHHANPSFG